MRSFNNHAIDAFLRAEIGRLPVRAGMRLLDLGCGARPYAPLYREKFGECVAGDYVSRTDDLDIRLDAQALPFGDNMFDCVLFSEVVEHVPDAPEALAEIARVLRPGGTLLITWPFMYMMHEVPNDYVRFTEFGMARLLASNGLKVEALARRGGALALAFVIAEFLLGGFLEALTRLPVGGRLFKPVKSFLLWLVFALPTRGYFALLNRRGLTYRRKPGEALSGWRGHLDHWTLGYCVLARKEGGP
jgi:SAM-dependent methyltransferase